MTEAERTRLRDYRKRTGNAATKKYEKTPNGFLLRLYHNMQSRVKGIQKLKAHLYKGKEILPRESFYEWAKSGKEFYDLFAAYEASGYDMKMAPTVDRVDSDFGYTIDNIRWLTHSDNSAASHIGKEVRKHTEEEKIRHRNTNREKFGMWWYNEKTGEKVFKSIKEMHETYGIARQTFAAIKYGTRKTTTGWKLLTADEISLFVDTDTK